MKKFFKDCLTGLDGSTYDPSRVFLFGAVVVFLVGALAHVWYTKEMNFQDYGIGFGALLAGGGLGISLKAKTEPAQ